MKQIKLKKIKVDIDKLVTMAEMGLGVVRPLNKEKKGWIAKLKKDGAWDPILVTPIKDSGYYLLTDGWHRVQAATSLKRKTINALQLPANAGLSMAKANKILRDIDREFGFKLECSNIIGHWAMMQTLLED
jgi:hypothetical protein|tara:strand:- start:518 stop:910 length:393 start_codon:yes stop_codon:yes gene_type:complete